MIFARFSLGVFCGIICIFSAGCAGSRPYLPSTDMELAFFSRADKNVFPADIATDPERYLNTTVAWPGLVVNVKKDGTFKKTIPNYRIEIEHHFWDWIEEYGAQPEKVLLSPQGEGSFVIVKPFKTPPEVGDFTISYGTPMMGADKELSLQKPILRIFPEGTHTMKATGYGRPGAPIVVKDVPVPFRVKESDKEKETEP